MEAVHFVSRPFGCGRVVEAALSNELGRRKSAFSENGSISLTRHDSSSSSYSSLRRRSNASHVAYAPVHGISPRTPPIMRCTSREALSAPHAPQRGLTHPPPHRGSAAARAAHASSAPSCPVLVIDIILLKPVAIVLGATIVSVGIFVIAVIDAFGILV
jgi:hypothetical protein